MRNTVPTEAEIQAQIDAAPDSAEFEPRARSARYDRVTERIVIELTNGCEFAFPARMGQGLQNATADQLAAVEVVAQGSGVEWEEIGAGLWVPGLLSGLFGSRAWMRELGRAGGKVQSEAKARASRENGKKGGRPRKVRPEPAPPAEAPKRGERARRVA
jgi:Protein of unknown function (DUF2442)